MRLLAFALSLSALGLGSGWVIASGRPVLPPETAPTVESTGRAEPSRPPPTVPSRRPGVRTSLSSRTYAVEGQTADEVLASLLDHGPRSEGDVFFGLTEAHLGLRYERTQDQGTCVLTRVEVDLGLIVTLPDWRPVPTAEPTLARDWGRFRRALAGHEDRHRAIAEDAAEALHRALDGLRGATCAEVEQEAQRRLQQMEARTDQAQRRYDATTEHGRTEGAVWPS